MSAPVRIEVFHIDRATGWAFAPFDAEGDQIGEASYEFRQRDAISQARRDHPDLPTHVFNSDGTLRRVYEPESPGSIAQDISETEFTVIITRDVTESTVVTVKAASQEQAGDVALEKLSNSMDAEWELDDGSWNNGDPYVTDVSSGHADLTVREYGFAVNLCAVIRVEATSPGEARRVLSLSAGSMDCNGGAWPDGDPILFNAEIEGEPELIEVDGEDAA